MVAGVEVGVKTVDGVVAVDEEERDEAENAEVEEEEAGYCFLWG